MEPRGAERLRARRQIHAACAGHIPSGHEGCSGERCGRRVLPCSEYRCLLV